MLGLHLQFRSINEIIPVFHSAEEDKGNRQDNCKQKDEESDKAARVLFDRTHPQHAAFRKLLQHKCEEWGVIYNPNKIFLASDDSTFSTHRTVWKNFKKALRHFVPDTLLKSAGSHDKKNKEFAGPGAETGPIAAAATIPRMLEAYVKAARQTCNHIKDHIEATQELARLLMIKDTKTFMFRSLTEASVGLPSRSLDAETPLYLHMLGWPHGELVKPEKGSISATGQYLRRFQDSRKAIGDDYRNYLGSLSTHHEIVLHLWEIVSQNTQLALTASALVNPTVKSQTKKRDFTTIYPVGSVEEVSPKSIYDLLSLEKEFEGADCLEFKIFDPTDDKARRENYYKLFSAIVAKQLDARYMNIPIIIHDDGCWTPALKLCTELTNLGMHKDFDRSMYEGGPLIRTKGVLHHATAFFDVLTGTDTAQREKAAKQVKAIRAETYSRFHLPDGIQVPVDGALKPDPQRKEKPENYFSVAVFTSASSDNRRLSKTLEKYGKYLADSNAGLIWGGGDRHAMGAIYDGFVQRLKSLNKLADAWLAGFNTRIITKSETRKGEIPKECHFPRAFSPNIYKRMADIISYADAIVVAPGGPGTTQELLAALILRDKMPDIMKNKPLIIYTPDLHARAGEKENLFWESAMEAFIGRTGWQELLKNSSKGVDGIYVAKNLDELRDLTNRFKSSYETQYGPKRGPDPKTSIPKRLAA